METRKKKPMPEAARPYQFKPGQSGNPQGGRLHKGPRIPRVLRNLTIQVFRDVIELVVSGNIAELEAMASDPNISALQVGVAASFAKALKNGDWDTIEKITQRIVGKIPDELNVNSTNLNADVEGKTKKELVKKWIQKLETEV